jgi:hypothetical protein
MAYVTVAELTAILGPGADTARAQLACDAMTEWINVRTGRDFSGSDPFAGPMPERVHQLALNGAARMYHDPEAPFGVIHGAQELPMYMRSLFTDADALLLGLRTDFGIG